MTFHRFVHHANVERYLRSGWVALPSLALLSEGLDLCVRARKLDAQDRTNAAVDTAIDGKAWEESGLFAKHAAAHNALFVDQPMLSRSATLPLWMLEQYEHDLAAWERKAREHLRHMHMPVGERPARAGGE